MSKSTTSRVGATDEPREIRRDRPSSGALRVVLFVVVLCSTWFAPELGAEGLHYAEVPWCEIVREPGRPPLRASGGGTSAEGLTFRYLDWPSQADEDSITAYVELTHPIVESLIGVPAVPSEVAIRYDPDLWVVGAYFPGANEIRIKWLPSKFPGLLCGVIAHEIVHAMHGPFIMPNVFEEGSARSIEMLAMSMLENPFYLSYFPNSRNDAYNVTERLSNQPSLGCAGGYFGISGLNRVRYALAGDRFHDLHGSWEGEFHRQFQTRLIEEATADPAFTHDLDGLVGLIQELRPNVDGIPFDAFWEYWRLLNFTPPQGEQVYLRPPLTGGRPPNLLLFARDTSASEWPLADVAVDWHVADRSGATLMSGTLTTNSRGWAMPLDYDQYSGWATATFSAHAPRGVLRQTMDYWHGPYDGLGLFGLVEAGASGEVAVVPLDGTASFTASVLDGAFSVPELEGIAGAYQLHWNETVTVVRKDIYPYFVDLTQETPSAVELTSFDAVVEGSDVSLTWSTGWESGTLSFTVLRSATRQLADASQVSECIPTGEQQYAFIDRSVAPGQYMYWLQEITRLGRSEFYGPRAVTVLPRTTRLVLTSAPNPFRESTRVAFTVADPGPVRLHVYDVAGRHVRTLVDAVFPRGPHAVLWDASTLTGERVPPGTYFYSLRSGFDRRTGKTLVR